MTIDIADDIRQDLKRAFSKDNLQRAEVKVLEGMDKIKNRETQQGKSPADGGRWNNTYNRQYARRQKGGRRSPVTLRNSRERIEQTETVKGKSGSKLTFRNGKMGQIFYLHDRGEARGGKYRQIYPDSDAQVPEELDAIALKEVHKLWLKS